MNENLDLTKILEGCPAGTEFYSTLYGKVPLIRVYHNVAFPIVIVTGQGLMGLTSDGRYFDQYDGECTLFPSKDQRDWSKFERFWAKPKVEKFDPKTLKPFDKVLVRDDYDDVWCCRHFSHIRNQYKEYKYATTSSSYKCCIPYNDETKHLLNTTDEAPKYYKY